MPSLLPTPFHASLYTLSRRVLWKFAGASFVAAGLILLSCTGAQAQGGVPLVTVATDQTPLDLSNQFGIPAGTAINQGGDFAFVGNGETALFLRLAGLSAASRLLQIYDQVPGFPGSQIVSILPELGLNSSRKLLFGLRFTGADHSSHAALLTYDPGSMTYQTVVTSDQTAPGSSGANYGLGLVPGSIDDTGDVAFESSAFTAPSGPFQNTIYILASGAPAALRIVGSTDTPPPSCTWCSLAAPSLLFDLGVVGVPAGSVLPENASFPPLNARGQILLALWGGLFVGAKDGSLTLVPMPASSGSCGRQPYAQGTAVPSGSLNNSGAVVFTNPGSTGGAAICVVSSGSNAPTAVVSSGASAPAGAGGGTISSPSTLGFDDSGDIAFQSLISGSNLTIFALLRYNSSTGQTDVVAHNCESAAGTSGAFFSATPSCGGGIVSVLFSPPFRGVSIANGGNVSFNAYLTTGQSAIYTQTGSGAPQFVSFDADGSLPPSTLAGATGAGVNLFGAFPTEILNDGSVLFLSYLTSGPADFAIYLGTPGNVQTLMSTADQMPSGAPALLGTILPRAAGHFVLFTAQPAAGRKNLMEADLSSSAIARVASDNDPGFATVGAPGGATALFPDFYVNENGQVAFEAVSATLGSESGSFVLGPVDTAWNFVPAACGTIFLWSPGSGLAKVAAAGDAVPNSTAKFSCVALNSGRPSPLNRSGDVAFISPSLFGPVPPCFLCGPLPQGVENGDFLYSAATGTVSEIAAAGDTLPGQAAATTFIPALSVPVNASGQAAFGAEVGTSSWDFFLRTGNSVQKIVANGDAIPGSGDTFGYPHFPVGLADSGSLAFTAGTGTASDGLFIAPAGSPIETLALDGGPAPLPGGGTYLLATPPSSGVGIVSLTPFEDFAGMNDESDVAFDAIITGGSTGSALFRALQCGSGSCTVQPVALQGQSAPGGKSGESFGAFGIAGSPLSLGQDFSLGPDGSLAFVNRVTTASAPPALTVGMFVARPDGSLLKVVESGDVLPGGGILDFPLISTQMAAGEAGEFAFLAEIAGGNARRGVFVTAIPSGTAATTTALAPLQNLVVAQQSVTLTATVTSTAQGAPTGAVSFFSNGISLGSGSLNGSGQASVTTSSIAAGPDSIVAQYAGDKNFASDNSAPMAIVAAGFAPVPTSLSVTAGQSLVIPLTVYAPAGSNLSFMLSCSGLPANSSCMFDTNPVAPTATGTTVNLTLATMAASKQPSALPQNGTPLSREVGIGALLATLFAASLASRRPPRLASCACFAICALALGLSGCGAITSTGPGASGTPQGTATITITGTSGTATISTVLKVTVH